MTSTKNYRTPGDIRITQQMKKTAYNDYTVKTWIQNPNQKTPTLIANDENLSRKEARQRLSDQMEYAEDLIENYK